MRPVFISILMVLLTACSSMQSIEVQDVQQQGDRGEIQVGDRVEIVTRNDEKLAFAVTDIGTEGIGGKFGFIPYHNMRSLKVKRPGRAGEESYGWVWALLGVAALAALVVSADSVTVCSGSPCPQ